MTDEPARLFELYAKADAFFERVRTRHPGELACGSGCHDCCAPGLTVTSVEARAIRDFVRARPVRPARWEGGDRCAALARDGTCTIYAVRPLVCRTHGVPIRVESGQGKKRLPVVQACSKNFSAGFDAVATDAILDQSTLSTVLFAVDAAYAAEQGEAASARTAVADLLAGP